MPCLPHAVLDWQAADDDPQDTRPCPNYTYRYGSSLVLGNAETFTDDYTDDPSVMMQPIHDGKILQVHHSPRNSQAPPLYGYDGDIPPIPPFLIPPLPNDSSRPVEARWKEYARVVLPHIGLVLLCTLYTVLGALVFYLIEKPNEIKLRERHIADINVSRYDMLEQLWDLVHESQVAEDEWREAAFEGLNNFTGKLFEAFEDRYVSFDNIRYGNVTDTKWTFPSAVFFAATTITTIGYGDLVPVTTQGRVLCILYGLLGVPLMLVTIADMGKFISDFILVLYSRYYFWKKNIQRNKAAKKGGPSVVEDEVAQNDLLDYSLDMDGKIPVTLILLIVIGYTAFGGFILRCWETNWSFFDSFYFSFITMTTVGFGDYVPQNQTFYILTLVYILLGLAITTMCVDLAGSVYIRKIHFMGRKIQSAKEALRTMGEVMRYAAFLRKKYGLNDEQLQQMTLVPDNVDWQDYLSHRAAYVPKDIQKIHYIDQLSDSLRTSAHGSLLSTVRAQVAEPDLTSTSRTTLLNNHLLQQN